MGFADMPFIEGTMWADVDFLGIQNDFDDIDDSEFSSRRTRMAIVKRKMPKGTVKKVVGKKVAVEASDDADLYALPEELSEVSNNLWDYSILLFGEKKIGKTDLTAQAPRTFHLMFEPGGKAQRIFQRPVPTWKAFRGYLKNLKKDKGRTRRFDTVAVDTVDMMYLRCFEHMCQKLGMEHPADEAYGKGWAAIKDEFLKGISDLLSLDKGVILISHAMDKKMKMRGGEEYDKVMPTLANQGREIAEGMVDLWFYYGYSGTARVLTIAGSESIGAGHRLKTNFRYSDGTPVREISMGDSAEEGYANLIAAFNNQMEAPVAEKKKTGVTILKKKKR